MDNANEDLSKRLHKVLDVIGASEYTRKKHWEFAIFSEITVTLARQLYDKSSTEISSYIVGSSCEGTTTPDLNSDIDILNCYEDNPVVDNLVESRKYGKSYLILTDEDARPGYVRLQVVKDQIPLSVGMCNISEKSGLQIDGKGKICFQQMSLTVGQNSSRNGPADTFPAEHWSYPLDIVCVLRCRKIPILANNWLNRTRRYDWPSQEQLRSMGSYGCFLVGVGHPHSDNKYIEWRISFSLQERDLMSSLNETQHKCYILLKMIKKDIIESKIGESISSYHCKTSLFYTIENSQRHIWDDGNLILCARLCLVRILRWVKAKHCPNYFIPEGNMFDKLSPLTLKTIEIILIDILDTGVRFLYKLTCENAGLLLQSDIRVYELACSLFKRCTIGKPRLLACYTVTRAQCTVRNTFLRQINVSCDTNSGYMKGAMQLLLYLQNTNHLTEHTSKDVRMAIDSIISHIQLQYEQCLFSQYLFGGGLSCVGSDRFQNVISGTSSDIDLISSKLSLASLYIQSEQLTDKCKCILLTCENSLEPHVVSVCGCSERGIHSNYALAEKLRFTDMTTQYFSRHCTTSCMVFQPSQSGLVHTTLQYELFRNVYTNPGSEFETIHSYWLNWITVDSRIYLYLLQYLLYSKNKNKAERVKSWSKLAYVLETDYNLGHKETAMNVLGWICLHENDVHGAWRFFCLSWKIRPFRNAAKWHMLILLRDVIIRR